MAKACYEDGCLRPAVRGEARCEEHHRPVIGARARAHAARRAGADGDGARRRLRNHINTAGHGVCAACGGLFPAGALEVDHIVPLANGGTDFAWNVQVLCRGCHGAKSASENRTTPLSRRAPTVAERRRRW